MEGCILIFRNNHECTLVFLIGKQRGNKEMLMSPNDYFRSTGLNRRDTIRLLGRFAGVGAVAATNLLPSGTLMAAQLPRGGIIRTALKDVAPESLGEILVHEHLQASSTYISGRGQTPPPGGGEGWVSQFSNNMDAKAGEVWVSNFSENLDLMIEEMKLAQKDGITAIVDCGPPLHWTERTEYLRQISKLSGMAIIIRRRLPHPAALSAGSDAHERGRARRRIPPLFRCRAVGSHG